ncbi:dihydrofolate reductase family protein [Stackebrandtia nassauensis]|uniref:Bifunctional deaminase-reductase domain protein n=1 Tax=Stackebrandtia nassauensis (strain DSM 44728 / CIP 108903 / NRRL B-16338 / NBRC 102104 / LLR-40K-21) TaxID=446470 RepID=D3Q746_STANL|nr:dihydrofolate reductase family protein [Stackebrandtia nassauensis]ADD42317.1 bifunctional deaminase-reductase domain protein [Stackebrandtia nassauensis DSM 44728]
MTKTLYYTATSIDGFIADADNSLSWLFAVDSGGEGGPPDFAGFFAGVGAMCLGATTYQWMLDNHGYLDKPDDWRAVYGDTPCWVFTHRSLPVIPGADVRMVSGEVAPVHEAMTDAAADKNIWILGGGELAGHFADAGLLDELNLMLAPVTLGAGAPVLPRRLLSTDLRLVDMTRHGQMAQLTYELRH